MNREVWRCFDDAQIEILPSLIMYPIPKPSPEVGPNPNCRSEGLPQLDVDRIVVLSLSHPASAKSAGIECCTGAGAELLIEPFSESTELRCGDPIDELIASGLDGRVESQPSLLASSAPSSSIARCQIQYNA